MERLPDLSIEDAKLIFKNFAGQGDNYNREGDKNFCVVLEDDNLIEDLIKDGWNVKQLQPRDEEDDPLHYLPVACKYGQYPPEIYLISGKTKTLLDEDSVQCLDYADIITVDIIINPYPWEIQGKDGIKSGIKAYVKKMYVTIARDEFADKYDFDSREA